MNIVITGSSSLTRFDKLEIRNYLEQYTANHEVHLLCYRSVENEVLSFYIENDEYAHLLHIYTFQPLDFLPDTLKQPIQYLREKGSRYTSFNKQDVLIKRNEYIDTWKKIMTDIDIVVCCYNGDKPSALIPIDIATELGINPMILPLPGYDEAKLDIPIEKKIRLIDKNSEVIA